MDGSRINENPELCRTIGKWQVLFYGLGSMLGAGVYVLIGKAAGILGNAVWLAFAAAMVAALTTGLSYASVGSRYPKAGGAAYVTQRAYRLGWLGYAVGISVMMSGLTSMATGSLAIAANLAAYGGLAIPEKIIAIVLVMMLGSVIYRGIRESMWANMFCTFVEVAGLLFIIGVGIRFWGGVNLLEVPDSAVGTGLASTEFLVLDDPNRVSLASVWLAVTGASFTAEMQRRVTGTSGSHQRIGPADAMAIEVPDTRLADERTLSEADSLLRLTHQTRIESQTLAGLRDALLPELLSGRLRVPEAREQVEVVV